MAGGGCHGWRRLGPPITHTRSQRARPYICAVPGGTRALRAVLDAPLLLLPPLRCRFMQSLVPGAHSADMRHVLAYMHLLDVNGNGSVEWKELMVALRVSERR